MVFPWHKKVEAVVSQVVAHYRLGNNKVAAPFAIDPSPGLHGRADDRIAAIVSQPATNDSSRCQRYLDTREYFPGLQNLRRGHVIAFPISVRNVPSAGGFDHVVAGRNIAKTEAAVGRRVAG